MADSEQTTKDLAVKADGHPMSGLMPVNYSDKFGLAKILSKSGLVPQSLDTPEKVFIALQMGHELGLSPMVAVSNITAINGRPTLSADLMLALCRKHPDFVGVKIEATAAGCTVVLNRRNADGSVDSFTSTFSEEDAKRAGLLNKKGPWQEYRPRMYRARSLAFACRDAFSDVLAGLLSKEEAIDIAPEEPRNVTEDPLPAARAELIDLLADQAFTEERRKQYAGIIGTITTTETLGVIRKQIVAERDKKPPVLETDKASTATEVVAKKAQMNEAAPKRAAPREEPPKVDEAGQQEIF